MSCSAIKPKKIKLQPYLGEWNSFEQTLNWYQPRQEVLNCVKAKYELHEPYEEGEKASFQVLNTSASMPTPRPMVATAQEGHIGFKVAPPGAPDLGGSYWVLDTDSDPYSIVSGGPLHETSNGLCSPPVTTEFLADSGLFVLTREPFPSLETLALIGTAKKSLNLDTSQLLRVDQSCSSLS